MILFYPDSANPSSDRADACVATGTALSIAGIVATAGTAVTRSYLEGRAINSAADKQTAATTQGAQLQDAASRRAEALLRQQAETDWRTSEQTRRANYDQWAAGRGRLRSLASMTGIDLGGDPGYVPGIDPGFDGSARPTTPPSGAPGPAGVPGGAPAGIDWTAPPEQLSSQLTAFFQSRGVAPTEVPYWVSHAGELVARGRELNNPNYANDRLAAAEILGGGRRPAAPPTSTTPRPTSMADLAYRPVPTPPQILAPGVSGFTPPVPYAPQTYAPDPYTRRPPYSFADLVR